MAVTSPLRASVVLAVPWTIMHVVLLLPGRANEGADLWPSVLSLFAYSVVLTWVFIGTGGSVLMSALVHAGLNAVVPIMWGVDSDLSWALRAVLAAVLATAIMLLGGLRRQRGRPRSAADAVARTVSGSARPQRGLGVTSAPTQGTTRESIRRGRSQLVASAWHNRWPMHDR